MQFKPIKQINTILKQQYFEPTISWSFRVVLALNVPLIVIPIYKGFSYEVIWAALGAYMLSLIDYRGQHAKKIIIQALTTLLVFVSALLGMWVGKSTTWSVISIFFVGICLAIIRNWRDYGPSVAVSTGFFFLFGLASPVSFDNSIENGLYLLVGCGWAILITVLSFPFQPSNPMRRSIAKIWKANTDLLDVMIRKLTLDETVSTQNITEKELAIRNFINQSRDLFASRENKKTRLRAQHYDQMIALRKTASLFAASCSSLNEALEIINTQSFQTQQDVSFYKALSAYAQASARLSIAIFTQRNEDLVLAQIRVKRCEAVSEIFTKSIQHLGIPENEKQAVQHFSDALVQALQYLQLSIVQLETKQNIKKSDYLENYKLTLNEFMLGLRPVAFTGFVTELLRVNIKQLKYALRVAVGLSIGTFIFKFFRIDHGYWIPLTMMIVIQPYYGATLKKGLERMLGTVAGIIVGGLIMLLKLPAESFVGILIIDSFFVAYFLRNNYKVGVFFVTIMMVLLMQISQLVSWQLIGWRILSTMMGAAIALIAGYAFWPEWEKARFPNLLQKALIRNKSYLLKVIDDLRKKLQTGDSWHRARRIAEGANNDAFSSVQRMLEEPKHTHQETDRNFTLVGSCVRISREITSIGLYVDKSKLTFVAGELDEFYNVLSQVFDRVLSLTAASIKTKEFFDFEEIKMYLSVGVFATSQSLQFVRLELEKIVFELEAMVVLLRDERFTIEEKT